MKGGREGGRERERERERENHHVYIANKPHAAASEITRVGGGGQTSHYML